MLFYIWWHIFHLFFGYSVQVWIFKCISGVGFLTFVLCLTVSHANWQHIYNISRPIYIPQKIRIRTVCISGMVRVVSKINYCFMCLLNLDDLWIWNKKTIWFCEIYLKFSLITELTNVNISKPNMSVFVWNINSTIIYSLHIEYTITLYQYK